MEFRRDTILAIIHLDITKLCFSLNRKWEIDHVVPCALTLRGMALVGSHNFLRLVIVCQNFCICDIVYHTPSQQNNKNSTIQE